MQALVARAPRHGRVRRFVLFGGAAGEDEGSGPRRRRLRRFALPVAAACCCGALLDCGGSARRRADTPATPHAPGPGPAAGTVVPQAPEPAVQQIRRDAKALEPDVRSSWVKAFLRAADDLPEIAPRTLYHDAAKTRFYSETEAASLAEDERSRLATRVVDEGFYYNTRYGTPLAYARPLDLVAAEGFEAPGRKILDFGYGGIGQLRLLASLGARVCGIEIDPLTRALYTWPRDQGTIAGRDGRSGTLHLVHGRFPSDAAVRADVGDGYDLVISKNVLKRGYIHPAEPVPDAQRIDLGVTDEVFVASLFSILAPGGRVLIYNLCPAPSPPGTPYKPWADGRCPFPISLWEDAGFHVAVFDRDDSAAARRMAHTLRWDAGDPPMDLEKDLFALYTLVVKPGKETP